MKPFVTLLALTLASTICSAQIDFQPGYYILNNGARVNCLVKDYEWAANPTAITCKRASGGPAVTIGMDSLLEFSVGNAKYVRFDVDVETSGSTIEQMSDSPAPAFQHERVLLKVLVEGRASLYVYARRRSARYFYRLNNESSRPLVYKEYLGEDQVVHANPEYLKVLNDSINCTAANAPDPTTVRYGTKPLVRYFVAYNKCVNSAVTDYYAKAVKTALHVNIRAGIDMATITTADNATTFSYGKRASLRVGAEAELILPFNRNKWSVVLGADYRSYHSFPSDAYFPVDYKAVQGLAGVRYYLFLTHQLKLYLSGLMGANFNLNSNLAEGRPYFRLATALGPAFGAGLQYAKRFSVGIQYQPQEEVLDIPVIFSGKLSATTLILSYR